MQDCLRESTSFAEKCRCCLAEGMHEHLYDAEIFKNCLNLDLSEEPTISATMCSACHSFLLEVLKFRTMVLQSQDQLLATVLQQDPTAVYVTKDEEIDKIKVKTEIESNELSDSSNCEFENLVAAETDFAEFKKENKTLCGNFVDDFENKEFDITIKEETDISLKRSKQGRKKRKKYDSESDTPIAQIKDKKLKKLDAENISTYSIRSQPRKHTFIDNSKIRSNLILVLKHSTIVPFRNNFKSTFKCFYCDNVFIMFKELKQHTGIEHADVSEAMISKIVRSLQNLIITADIGCIKCKVCDTEFKSIENLIDHLCNIHHKTFHETEKKPSHGILGFNLNTDTLKCHMCNKDFAFFKNLSVHMNEHYGSFVCYVCGKKFLSEHRYKCHEFKAHSKKETKCKHCGEVFKTEPAMTYHIRKEHIKGILKCVKCPETFRAGQYIKRVNHMAEAHGIQKPKFKCDACGKEYANSGSLAAHKRYTHKRIRELRCELCGYITVHNSVMKHHMDFHNGVKNYECEYCKKKFGKPYTLKLHMKIHLNDKKFACSLCDAAFIQKNSLKSHLKSRHADSGIDLTKL